ncbi:MAG: hypothetical protein Q9212_000523 [Teloschistes hypoglaucus]
MALSATSSIKILRATRPGYGNYQLYEMLEITTLNFAINDVSWAPGGIRPYDLLATACDDGLVRLYEVTTPGSSDQSSTAPGLGPEALIRQRHASSTVARQTLSGIGAGLAGVSQPGSTRRAGGHIQHAWKEVAVLSHDDGAPVWRVRWTHDGSVLASTGDSGNLHLWKQDLSMSVEFLDARCHGGRNGRKKFVNEEDVLISRGANPRTGIISPFIQEELHQAGFENDYIHVRGVHQVTNKKTGAHEQWRQDALGWTLIECQSGRSSRTFFRNDTMDGDGTKAVPGQLIVPTERQNLERRVSTGAEEFDKDQTATVTAVVQSDSNHAPQMPKVTTLPKEIYLVPRKQVRSATIAPMPSSVAGVNRDATSSIKSPRPPLNRRRARPPLPAHLAAEDVVLGYHAYPSVSSRSQQTNSDQSIPRPTVKQSDGSNMCEPCDEKQTKCWLNDDSTAVSPPIPSIPSRLGIKYRRPKHLLPAWLRGQYASNLESRQVNTDRDLHSSCGASGTQIVEGRLHDTGLPRLGEVPLSNVGVEMEGEKSTSTRSYDKQTSKTLQAVHIARRPSTSTCAAYGFHNGEFEETRSRSRQPGTRFEIDKTPPPSFDINGVPVAEQKTSIRPPRLTAWGPPNPCDDLVGPTSEETPMHQHHHQPMTCAGTWLSY